MRRADATTPAPIAGTEGGEYATISPDGRRIAFMRPDAAGTEQIVALSIDGGELKTVVADPMVGTRFGWTDADHIVYASPTGLMRAPVTGGDLQRMTKVDIAAHELLHLDASGLPGGGAVFTTASRNADSSYIGAVGPGGGNTTLITPGLVAIYAQPGYLIVTRSDGSLVAIPFDVKRLRVTGAPVLLVSGLHTGTFSTVGHAAAAASGRLVFVSSGWSQTSGPTELVWVTRTGERSAEDPGKVLIWSVALSPDGRRVASGIGGDASEDIRVRELATGAVRHVAIPGTILRDPVFSRDGRHLFFMGLGASHGVHRLDLDSPAPPVRLGNSEFLAIGQPTVGPSGDLFYYSSGTAGGIARRRIGDSVPTPFVIPAAGSRASRPQLSPDGRWLAYLSTASGKTVVRVRSTDSTRSDEWRASTADGGSSLRWSRAGDALFYVAGDSMMEVHVTTAPRFTLGDPHALFSTAGLTPVFDVGPDGRFFMIRPRPDTRPPTELTMFERWQSLLPR